MRWGTMGHVPFATGRKVRRPGVVAAALASAALLAAACNGAEEADGSSDPDASDAEVAATGHGIASTPELREDPSALACEVLDFPCTWDEVDADRQAATAELGGELGAMADGAWDAEELADHLSQRDDVVDAAVGNSALWFRLQDARPVWVFADDVFVTDQDGAADADADADAMAAQTTPAAGPPSTPTATPTATPAAATIATPTATPAATQAATPVVTTTATSTLPQPEHPHQPQPQSAAVVGDDPSQKSALVLSIYDFQNLYWGANEVADLLRGTRGYEGNVDVRANSAADEGSIGPDDFTGWDAYDVVYVATHGAQICDDGHCWTALSLGASPLEAEEEDRDDEALLTTFGYADTPGVTIAWGRGQVLPVLEGDWLAAQYAGGLEDTLVYVQACSSARAGDLTAGLSGDRSVFLGWSDTAFADDAGAAAVRFFEEATERGVTSETAYGEVTGAGLHITQGTYTRAGEYSAGDTLYRWEDGAFQPVDPPDEEVEIDARLEHHAPGTDLRLREVIELQDPISGQRLQGGEVVALADGSDGGPSLPVRIQVDGVLDGEAGAFAVDLVVNDVAVEETWQLDADATQVDDETYVIEDTVTLPVDMGDEDTLTLEATTQLPEGGISQHIVEVHPADYEFHLEAQTHVEGVRDLQETAHVVGSFPLEHDPETGEWFGDAPADWLTYTYNASICAQGGGALDTTSDVQVERARVEDGQLELDLEWIEERNGPRIDCGPAPYDVPYSEHEVAVTALVVALGGGPPMTGPLPDHLFNFVGPDTVRFDDWQAGDEPGSFVYERSDTATVGSGSIRGEFRMELRQASE